jgi:hypothetical protein
MWGTSGRTGDYTSAYTSKLKINTVIKNNKKVIMSVMQVCYRFWTLKLVVTILCCSGAATRVVPD